MANATAGRRHIPVDQVGLDLFFDTMPDLGASDLHMKAGRPMMMRISGVLRPLDMPKITAEQSETLCCSILTESQKEQLEATGSVDLAYSTDRGCRVRVNIFYQRGTLSMAARYVNATVPGFDDLMLPSRPLKRLCSSESGLIIVAGATGAGKSTSLAAMIDHINHTRKCHILTLEDPIEYLFEDDLAIINQREIGIDADSFESGLKYALREDPDVILMGEMRDAETVTTALSAAETGHLVFGTLHANTAPQTIDRLLDLFPGDKQPQVRKGLVFNLRAVICQRLLRCTKKNRQRVPALEIMITTAAVRKLISEAKDEEIYQVMRDSPSEGMVDFTHSIYQLVQNNLVTRREGVARAPNPDALQSLLDGLEII